MLVYWLSDYQYYQEMSGGYFHERSWHNIYSEFIHNFKSNCIQMNYITAVVVTNVY